MAASCRFAFAIHILAVLALHGAKGTTSERLARSVNTNPVIIRRVLSVLRKTGFVCCSKGAGGGATLCRPPESISLEEIYRAVEPEPAFSAHPQKPSEKCPVGRKIELVLDDVFSAAQRAFESELARRTLADVMETMADSPSDPTIGATRPRLAKTV